MSEEDQLVYLKISRKFRQEGHSIEIYPSSAKMKKQMNYANKRGVKNVIFYGEQERHKGVLKIKNMATGTEIEKPL